MVDSADSASCARNAQLAGDRDARDPIDPGNPAAEFLDTVLDGLTDGVLACSRSGVPIVVNRAARLFYESVVGTPWDDHAGRAWLDDLIGRAAARESRRRGTLMSLHELTDVEVTVTGVTTEHTVRLTSRPVARYDRAPIASVITLHDHSRQRAEERRLAREATHDPVTGLPARAAVMRLAGSSLANPATRPVGLLFVDVERLRDVNDRHGYHVGDRLLGALARDLADEVGEDGWVGHLGGDRFVVLVTGEPRVPYDALAERVTAAVARPRRLDGAEVSVTATVGIAVSPDANGGAPSLLYDAETAMRHARALTPGGHATFVASMRADTAERALSEALRQGELVVHYQPKVDLVSDRMCGVEALVRWERPGVGLVPPAEFVPLAESTGLVVELGSWVLRRACEDAARWHATHPDRVPLSVWVNVSPRQFEAGIADVVRDALQASGIPPATLGLEVTETAVMRDVDAATRTLLALRALGVHVAIDDFGTGYSSLAYLRRFPVDEMKIDKTFVDGLGSVPGDSALVAGMVSLAHALDLTVVAEGVETELQLAELRRIGCEVAQGFLFARPVPAAVIDALIAGERALPVVAAAAPDTPVPAVAGNDRVVIADDAADVLMLARLSLTSAGFDVMEVGDGTAAIEAVQRGKPSCVVLDVEMPGMDGLEVCRTLRSDPDTADCTIVMLTATDTASDKIAAFAAGADDYIVKPFSPRDLVGRLRAADRRRRGTPQPAGADR
jgi:diguanylate cyclase (GGDEF)-like protein